MRKFVCVVCGLCVCVTLGVRAARGSRHQKDQSAQPRGPQVLTIYTYPRMPRDLKLDQTTPDEAVRALRPLGQPDSDTIGPLNLIDPVNTGEKDFRRLAWRDHRIELAFSEDRLVVIDQPLRSSVPANLIPIGYEVSFEPRALPDRPYPSTYILRAETPACVIVALIANDEDKTPTSNEFPGQASRVQIISPSLLK